MRADALLGSYGARTRSGLGSSGANALDSFLPGIVLTGRKAASSLFRILGAGVTPAASPAQAMVLIYRYRCKPRRLSSSVTRPTCGERFAMRDQDRVSGINDDQIAHAEQHHQPRIRMREHALGLERDRIATHHVAAHVADCVPADRPNYPTSCHENRARTVSTLALFSMITRSKESYRSVAIRTREFRPRQLREFFSGDAELPANASRIRAPAFASTPRTSRRSTSSVR